MVHAPGHSVAHKVSWVRTAHRAPNQMRVQYTAVAVWERALKQYRDRSRKELPYPSSDRRVTIGQLSKPVWAQMAPSLAAGPRWQCIVEVSVESFTAGRLMLTAMVLSAALGSKNSTIPYYYQTAQFSAATPGMSTLCGRMKRGAP